ncbi:MAG: VCBS repeat-containing protein [Armatimonadetes bacterium]|nr:VCBS repeat-containing protein [Armatimonadota bacterium]
MKKWALWTIIFAAICFAFFFTPVWLSQLSFRLNRKVIAKLPYRPERLLVTDLDRDGRSEVLAVSEGKPPFWIRSPFDEPNAIEIAGCKAIGRYKSFEEVPMRSVPVSVGDKLRLLSWRNGKATFEPLPFLPDRVFDWIDFRQGKGIGTVFLATYLGANAWVFVLAENGEWKFAGKFVSEKFQVKSVLTGCIYDLADLDKDGKLDLVCLLRRAINEEVEEVWVIWGNERKGEKALGSLMPYGFPLIADLNGDGWLEIVKVDFYSKLFQVWSFDQKRKELSIITKLPILGLFSMFFLWELFDLDSDSLSEIVVAHEIDDKWLVFKLEGKRLRVWKGKKLGTTIGIFVKFFSVGERKCLVTRDNRLVLSFLPDIWFDGKKLRWSWRAVSEYSIFWELPEGKDALSPSEWRKHEAPFELVLAADIDGDGSDELIGRDTQGRYRLCWFRKTKSGELQWQSTLLGGRELVSDWALVKSGNHLGLCIAWDKGTVELLTMRKR